MRLIAALVIVLGLAAPARADGERAGEFDYFVMALSWSAAWCATTGEMRRDPQCDAGRGITFVLHGLWPQFEDGYPSYCRTVARDPSRGETAAVGDLFGGAGAAFYQWKKHGRCAGLSSRDYFALARRAFASVQVPGVFAKIDRRLDVPVAVVEGAFVEANPGLSADMVTVTCGAGLIDEVRICLTRDLKPRRCGADVIRDCRGKAAILPVR